MNENVMILTKSVEKYFENLNNKVNKLSQRAIPFAVVSTEETGGRHIVSLTEINIGGRMTMTSGKATIVRRGEMRDLESDIKPSVYTSKVVLYLKEHKNPTKLQNKLKLLTAMQNQDYIRIILNGERGKEPIPDGKGSNLRGGLLNFVGSVLLEGEIKSIDNLIDFVVSATTNIEGITDMTEDETEVGNFSKRYSLLVPSESGVAKSATNIGGGVFETLKEHLLRFYNTDLVVIPSNIIKMEKVVLIPASESFIYFHLDTFNEIHDFKHEDGQYTYEIHWGSAGVVVANPALIQTMKIKSGKLEGILSRNAKTDVNIINDPLNIKDGSKDKEPVEEAEKKAKKRSAKSKETQEQETQEQETQEQETQEY